MSSNEFLINHKKSKNIRCNCAPLASIWNSIITLQIDRTWSCKPYVLKANVCNASISAMSSNGLPSLRFNNFLSCFRRFLLERCDFPVRPELPENRDEFKLLVSDNRSHSSISLSMPFKRFSLRCSLSFRTICKRWHWFRYSSKLLQMFLVSVSVYWSRCGRIIESRNGFWNFIHLNNYLQGRGLLWNNFARN